MKNRNILAAAMAFLAVFVGLALGEPKYDTGTTAAEVTYGPTAGYMRLTSLLAQGDDSTSTIKFYAWNQAAWKAPTANATNGATVISVSNAGLTLTTNDIVVYVHASGAYEAAATVTNATTTNVTLSAAITAAGASGDKIYELSQNWQVNNSTVAVQVAGSQIYDAIGPVYIVASGTGACSIAVNAEKP
jgi:hypothetical protein